MRVNPAERLRRVDFHRQAGVECCPARQVQLFGPVESRWNTNGPDGANHLSRLAEAAGRGFRRD